MKSDYYHDHMDKAARAMKAKKRLSKTEGKSPHKKGTAKYKKHMAAMHAEGVEETKNDIEKQAIDFFTSIKSKIGSK